MKSETKPKILRLELLGALFIVLLGSVLHFTFDWSNKLWLVGIFSAVNESTWEHLKLAVIPALLWLLIEMGILKERPENFFLAKATGIYSMPLLIIMIFYSYKAVLGKNLLFLDILTFVIAVVIGQMVSYKMMFIGNLPRVCDKIAVIFIILLLFAFAIFTFYPPHIFLFQDPITLRYGIV
ncbi:hypothetical protein H5T88_09495 [bacterium]|nr:hypothetical protein [bacterium]